MNPKILVVYYSQSGQLREILDSLLQDIHPQCEIDFHQIQPEQPFPFPWTAHTFFDCMPESVLQIAEPIQPLHIQHKDYDLVILGYQPWFLSPSIPFNSFLQSPQAQILQGKQVLTVIGSRNMWLNAQEKTKIALHNLGATLCGNIVLFDRNPNLLSVLSIVRWSFKGQKEASRFLPAAGVQMQDIAACQRLGPTILQTIQNHQFSELQEKLLALQAVELKSALIVLEKRAIKNFKKFSKFIKEKGARGDTDRIPRVRLFQRLLFVGVFILSPISSLTASLSSLINKKKLAKEAEYFKNIAYKENAI
ncbi:MAG: hypothetical protein KA198_08680 [Chitinophagaceae bacterium]|nr:hypothetical protein [Chitinophagaceae bacterium]